MLYLPLKSRLRIAFRRTFLRQIYHLYKHRGIEPRDFILAGYTRSGSTWLAFMMSQVIWKVGRENSLGGRRFTPFLGYQRRAETRLPGGGRIIASHEPYRRDYQHAVCLVRDPRDIAVSVYYHAQRVMGLRGTFQEFLPLHMKGLFNGCGRWDRHIQSWLDSPLWEKGRAVLLRYEDLKNNTAGELRRAVEITGYRPTEEEIVDGIDAGRLDAMREREKASPALVHRETAGDRVPAVRKGIVGDWRNHFTHEDLEKLYAVYGSLMERLGYALEDAGEAAGRKDKSHFESRSTSD